MNFTQTRIFEVAFVLVLAAGPVFAAGQVELFVLAERGKPATCGLVVESKGPTADFAAGEFRNHVEKLTGVKLPDGAVNGRRVVLAPGAADLGDDGFRLVAKQDELRIEGGLRGVLFGVYELLETYGGVAWFSGWCEDLPQLDRLAVPLGLDDVQKPAFPAREIFWTHVTSDPVFAARLRTNNRSFRKDDPRTGGNSLRFDDNLVNCHTFNTLVPPEKYFKTHPEYFSEVAGKRLGERSQLCLTNPDVMAIATSNVLAAIRRNPSARCFGVSQNDWYNYCECAKCKALDDAEGSHAGTMIAFANRIADAVKEVAPDKLIVTDAYQYTQRPPKTIRPHDNVMVCLSTIECDFSRPFRTSRNRANVQLREDIRRWAAMTKTFHVWDYTTDFNNYLIPYPNVMVLQDNIRFFRENNVYYLFEQGAHGGYHGEFGELKAWLMAKWMWNPDLPLEPLLTRFLCGYYGKAAPAVREYFDLLHSFEVDERQPRLKAFGVLGNHPASSDEVFLAKASSLWRSAEAAVADDPVRSYNVRMSAMSIDYVIFMRKFKRVNLSGTPDDGSWKEPAARLSARIKEAAAARRPVLLCENKETDSKLRAKIVAAADGTFVTIGDGTRAWQEEGAFKRMGPKGATKLKDDAAASGGKAMWLANDNYNWYLTYLFDEIAFAPDEEYTLSVRLRADVTGQPGEVVQIGIYDYAKSKSVGVLSLVAGDLKDGYAEYDVKTWKPAPGQGMYIAAGHFDKKKFGVSPAHTGVWIDGFTIRRANIAGGARDRSVLSFGAKGDGRTVETKAIQAAIDDVSAAGGGRVMVPPGTYLMGTIYLKSGVDLHLEEGAVLRGSPNRADYCKPDDFTPNAASKGDNTSGGHLIVCLRQKDVKLSGTGTIDGNVGAFFPKADGSWPKTKHEIPWRPGQMLYFVECENVTAHGIRLRNSPYWSFFLHGCENVTIDALDVETQREPRTYNGDGIDIDSCEHVRVTNCRVRTDDDSITIRCDSSRLSCPRPCRDVYVGDCDLSSLCNCMRLGVGTNAVEDVFLERIRARDARNALSVTGTWSHGAKVGGHFRRITVRDWDVDCNRCALVFYPGPFESDPALDFVVEDVVVERFRATEGFPSRFVGKFFRPFRNIVLTDVDIRLKDGGLSPLDIQNADVKRKTEFVACPLSVETGADALAPDVAALKDGKALLLCFKTFSPKFARNVFSRLDRLGIAHGRVLAVSPDPSALAALKESDPALRRVARVSFRKMSGGMTTNLTGDRVFRTEDELAGVLVEIRLSLELSGFNLPSDAPPSLVDRLRRLSIWLVP